MEKVVKYTKAQKFADIEAILGQVDTEDYDIQALIEFVQGEQAALVRKAAKAKETAQAKKTELDELAQTVLGLLNAAPQTRDQIAEQIEDEEVTVAKVGARLSKLVAQGLAEKTEIAATSASGKKTTRMAYALVLTEAEPSDEE